MSVSLWLDTYVVTLRVYNAQGDSWDVQREVTVDRRHGPSETRACGVAREEALAMPDVVRVDVLWSRDAYCN